MKSNLIIQTGNIKNVLFDKEMEVLLKVVKNSQMANTEEEKILRRVDNFLSGGNDRNFFEPTTTYILEFSEKQQIFHLTNPSNHYKFGDWFTIYNECTDMQFHIYESYVKRIANAKLTKKYLMQCAKELEGFMANMREQQLSIKRLK